MWLFGITAHFVSVFLVFDGELSLNILSNLFSKWNDGSIFFFKMQQLNIASSSENCCKLLLLAFYYAGW